MKLVSREEWVREIFQGLGDHGICFLVLRNYENLPDRMDGDLDLLICQEDLEKLRKLLVTMAESSGFVLINSPRFSPYSLFFAQIETLEQVHIDLFVSLEWRGVILLDVPAALKRRRFFRNGMWVPAVADEALISLLTTLLFRGKVKDKYRGFLKEAFQNEREGLSASLGILAGTEGKRLAENVRQGLWSPVETAVGRLRGSLIWTSLKSDLVGTVCRMGMIVQRIVNRWVNPPGLMIVLLGPDGAGKTSVAEALLRRMEPSFSREKSLYVHWKPTLKARRNKGGPVSSPHQAGQRGRILSAMYLVYHFLGFWLGGIFLIRKHLFKNGLVVVDRYWLDLLVDKKRYQLDVPRSWIKFLLKLLPCHGRAYVLNASAEVFLSRKQEVSKEELERQTLAYRGLADEFENVTLVNASLPIEAVAEKIAGHTLTFLAEREAVKARDYNPE